MTFDSVDIPEHLYFATATLIGRKRLFAQSAYAQIVLDALAWLRGHNRMLLFAFVLMQTHAHVLVKPTDRKIGRLLQEFGSYTAHALLARLHADNETALVEYFHAHKRDARHQHSLWQDIQAKNIYTAKVLQQKIEYIHQNPVRGRRPLAEDRTDYVYSSACFYDRGAPPIIQVDDIRDYL